MSFGIEGLFPFVAGAAAGGLFSKSKSTPPPPTTIINQAPKMPEPTPPPRAAITPSQTAALQRARATNAGTGRASGNSDIVLTQSSDRDQDLILARKTLLGR